MKILYAHPEKKETGFSILPDSCLLRNNDSFYVPNFGTSVSAEACLVLKIDKLGKCFAERFSHRYYKQFTLGVHFIAEGNNLSPSISTGFDRSFAIGQFSSIENIDYDACSFKYNSAELTFLLQGGTRTVDLLCSKLSSYFSFKIGDLFAIPLGLLCNNVSIGDTFSVDNQLLPAPLITAVK